jgi:hypothetical protein
MPDVVHFANHVELVDDTRFALATNGLLASNTAQPTPPKSGVTTQGAVKESDQQTKSQSDNTSRRFALSDHGESERKRSQLRKR